MPRLDRRAALVISYRGVKPILQFDSECCFLGTQNHFFLFR
jgi:hypothetical protein